MSKEQEDLDVAMAKLSGHLMSSWIPHGALRRVIFFFLIAFGVFGVLTSSDNFLHYSSLILATVMSPRLMGELAYFLGKVSR